MGVVGYAGDLILFAPSKQAAKMMLQKCEQICMKNNINSSTHEDPSCSKSKPIYLVRPREGGLPVTKASPAVQAAASLGGEGGALGLAFHQDD